MDIIKISLDKLIPHPANTNVMSEDAMKKLRRHITRHGCYEPLVVRPHPKRKDCFELINGHHRRAVLEQMGHKQAECVVWQVSDEETLMLLATINRLSGEDDLSLRADLMERLSRRFEQGELLKQLPETRQRLQKLLELNKPTAIIEPAKLTPMPQAMTFFVSTEQKAVIEKAIRTVRHASRGDDPEGKLGRGDLLAIVGHVYLSSMSSL